MSFSYCNLYSFSNKSYLYSTKPCLNWGGGCHGNVRTRNQVVNHSCFTTPADVRGAPGSKQAGRWFVRQAAEFRFIAGAEAADPSWKTSLGSPTHLFIGNFAELCTKNPLWLRGNWRPGSGLRRGRCPGRKAGAARRSSHGLPSLTEWPGDARPTYRAARNREKWGETGRNQPSPTKGTGKPRGLCPAVSTFFPPDAASRWKAPGNARYVAQEASPGVTTEPSLPSGLMSLTTTRLSFATVPKEHGSKQIFSKYAKKDPATSTRRRAET